MISNQHGELPGSRDDATAVLHGDKMYLFGGFSHGIKTNSVYCFNFMNNEWTLIWSPEVFMNGPSPRSGHSAIIWEGKMVIFGGIDDTLQRLNDTWIFSLETFEWC